MRENPLIQTYFLLSPNTRAAPNPAMMPAAGAGVDVCCCGWLTGEETGCAKVGSGVASAVGVGSAAAGSHTDAPELRLEYGGSILNNSSRKKSAVYHKQIHNYTKQNSDAQFRRVITPPILHVIT